VRGTLRTSSTTEPGGTTLLELVVTLAVLALAATLALPRLVDRGGLALDAAAAGLRDALGFGRERAILGGARWRLVVDVDAGRWAIGRPGPDGGLEAPAGPLAAPVTLPRPVRVVAVRAGGGPEVRNGTAVVELAPDGDPLPVRIDLGDGRGRVASVVLPPAAARAEVR
jgi:type II secretory pathway pseudopilin PulG